MSSTAPHPSNRPIPPPLRPLALGSSYSQLRGLAWSPDAELAVASDDSVHVFVPRLIGSDGNPIPILDADDVDSDQHSSAAALAVAKHDDDSGGGLLLLDDFATDTETRSQFAAHSRHIPIIGALPVSSQQQQQQSCLNDRLHERQQTSPLLLGALLASQEPMRSRHAEAAPATATAGRLESGLLRGTWNMTNSVVAVAWSPAGVGRHSRSVIGVLTSSGMLIVYGERLLLDGQDNAAAAGTSKGRGRQNYDTSQWEILWAAGTHARVPGQDHLTAKDDRILSFAWTGAWTGPSFFYSSAKEDHDQARLRSLLVYMTDRDELVVLAVLHVHGADGGGHADWHVMEVARTTVTRRRAPTEDTASSSSSSVYDGAADVQCSAWLTQTTDAGPYDAAGTHVQTCLVGYLAGSYVGFLRITVRLPPSPSSTAPFVYVDDNVANGVCMDLLPTAFLRFEEGVWAVGGGGGGGGGGGDGDAQQLAATSFQCRAVVATPMTVNELELEIAIRDAGAPLPRENGGAALPAQTYPTTTTTTTTADAGDCTNPITGLVVHPPHPDRDRRGPLLYTVVRLSGTPGSASDLYESTLPRTDEGTPQWADEIDGMLAATTTTTAAGPSSRNTRGTPHVRFYGLAQAPGGQPGNRGVTAVLVEQHDAKGGSASGGSRHKQSRGSTGYVMFGWQDGSLAASSSRPHSGSLAYQRPAVSTEAKMWTYMYGGGPAVVGRPVGQLECSARVAALLSSKAASQRCSICDRVVRGQDAVASVCEAGHRFARCSATGLAIVRPNASHACGVCGSRTMHLGMLLDILNSGDADADADVTAAALDHKDVAALRHEVLGDTCKRCGGKFYD